VEFAPVLETEIYEQRVDSRHVTVRLQPGSRIRLRLTVRSDRLTPTYSDPW
jgi:hypothetical protein